MEFKPLAQDEVDRIATAPPEKRPRAPKKDLFAREGLQVEQLMKNWFKLPTTFIVCNYCDHNHMCAKKEDESYVCRRCFIVGDDLVPDGERKGHEDPNNVLQNYA